MVFLELSCLECPHSSSALWHGLWSQGHLQPVYRLEILQNLKLGQFILYNSLPLYPIYENGSVPLRMYLSCRKLHETLNWGSLFHTISPFFLLQQDDHCPKVASKSVKLWCKTSECYISWLNTTIHHGYAMVHAYVLTVLLEAFSKIMHDTCKS